MCDRWDIGGLSTNLHPQTGGPTIFIYDGHPGGIGIARTAFARFEELCDDARRLIAGCGCAERLPLLRAVAQVRQPQRAPLQGGRTPAAGADARRPSHAALNGARRLLKRMTMPPRSDDGRSPAPARCVASRRHSRRRCCSACSCAARRRDDPPRKRCRAATADRSIARRPRRAHRAHALDAAPRPGQPAASRLGWQRGGFAGASVSVPNVVEPYPYSGPAAQRATTKARSRGTARRFQAPTAGTYALTFESANFQASVWIDGHSIGSHRAPICRSNCAISLSAGTHTLVVRVDWRDPGSAEPTKASTAPGSTGAVSTARSACARSAQASCLNRRSRRRSRRRAPPRPRTCGSACRCATTAPPGERSRPKARSSHGAQTIALQLPRTACSPTARPRPSARA